MMRRLSQRWSVPAITMATPLLTEYPELSHLSRQELEDMLNDPIYFQAIFHSLHRVKQLYQSQTELGMANEAIARSNLILQDQLYALRSDTKDAFDEAKSLEKRWKELEKEQREVYQRFAPQFLLMRLKHSTTSQDDASEAVATAFIRQAASPQPASTSRAGAQDAALMDTDDFVREFRELRKVYHKRIIWADKWTKGQVDWREDHT